MNLHRELPRFSRGGGNGGTPGTETGIRRPLKRILPWPLAAALLFAAAHLFAAQPQDPKTIRSKTFGEDWAIRKRAEWFFKPRTAGANERLATLRAKAVEFTRSQEAACPRTPSFNTWACRGPSSSNFGGWAFGKVSGRIPALAKDWANNILYVGTASGGVWKSTDDGLSWTSIFDSAGTQTVGALAVDPNNSVVLWAGTGENTSWWCEEYFGIGLLRSSDGGATWEPRNGSGAATLEDLSEFCAVSIDPRNSSNLIVGGMTKNCQSGTYSSGGIYATADAGATWSKRLSGYVTSVVRDPNNPDILWAGVYYGGVYKSADNGVSWAQQTASSLPSGTNVAGRVEVAVAPSNGNYVYALFSYNNAFSHKRSELWRTASGGSAWTLMSYGTSACDGQCDYNMTLRVDRANPLILWRGTIQIFKSTNGGGAWTNLTGDWGSSQKVHQDTHFLLMNPADSNEFYVGCDGGVWKTTDGGTSFANLNANLNLTQFYAVDIHPANDDIIIGGAQDNSSLARTTSDTWDLQDVTGDGFVGLINQSNPNIVYIASYPYGNYPSVYRSSSGVLGPFSDYITGSGSGISGTSRIEWVTPYALDPNHSSTLFLGTYRMYKSTNNGGAWSPVGPSDMTNGGTADIYTVNIGRTNGNYVYAGTSDSLVWQSADAGATWKSISAGLPSRVITDIDPDPANPVVAFCTVSGFNTPHLYEYTGSEWAARGGGLPNVPANTVLALRSTELYVGTDVGIFVSYDRGQNFVPFNEGLPSGLVVTDLKYNAGTHTLTAGTYGRGAWQYAFAVPGEVSSAGAGALRWTDSSKTDLVWGQVSGSQGYRIYRGRDADLPSLPSGASVCLAYEGPGPSTGELLNAAPLPGGFFWYLAIGYNGFGEGSAGTGTATQRVLSSTGACFSP